MLWQNLLALPWLHLTCKMPQAPCAQANKSRPTTAVLVGVQVAGTRIRMYGIDAPEKAQACRKSGKEYACGECKAWTVRI